MKAEFVRFFTDDNIELQGLYSAPRDVPAQAAIVHVHGLAGSFYENRFVDYLADMLTDRGYAFLTFNNRGHDYLSDLLKKEDSDWTYVDGGRCLRAVRGMPLRYRRCSPVRARSRSRRGLSART